jgi:hypothetical protein
LTRLCAFLYTAVSAEFELIVRIWGEFTRRIGECTAQRCRWWCLCCNIWLCWILVIIIAIVVAILWLIWTVITILTVPVCWGTCILIFVFTLGGNFGRWNLNCFASDPTPAPSGPTVPSVSIVEPQFRAVFPDGDTVPITFRADAYGPDGTALTGSAVRWEEYLVGTVPGQYRLIGEGADIAATLPRRPADVAANLPSDYTIRVTATATTGRTASDSVYFVVGPVIS